MHYVFLICYGIKFDLYLLETHDFEHIWGCFLGPIEEVKKSRNLLVSLLVRAQIHQ